MENIEQTIVELGGIFSKLAHMVKEQEEEIKRFYIIFAFLTVLAISELRENKENDTGHSICLKTPPLFYSNNF